MDRSVCFCPSPSPSPSRSFVPVVPPSARERENREEPEDLYQKKKREEPEVFELPSHEKAVIVSPIELFRICETCWNKMELTTIH
ncbi:hypothetical protein QN277_019760 [Acacia crassicarpa]|uniref:Uncharacterized protein n=1 Tax=Acacia crassicarpa TaxID=499986 RepID=A0AAE1MNN2_9FABA|nr:hypothetical protein QN277_019760 [Acacia crassicarpa]